MNNMNCPYGNDDCAKCTNSLDQRSEREKLIDQLLELKGQADFIGWCKKYNHELPCECYGARLHDNQGDLADYILQREQEARYDELRRIPVIETTGVGYEVIVRHRMERLAALTPKSTESDPYYGGVTTQALKWKDEPTTSQDSKAKA